MYTDLRTATTASRKWKTPYELIKGCQLSLLKLQRFYTKAFVNVPPGKRISLQKKGMLDRAEPGRLIGYHSDFSSTYKVMLSKNRMVHSFNVTFDPDDCVHISPQEAVLSRVSDKLVPWPQGASSEAAQGAEAESELMHVDVEKCDLFNLHPGTSTDEYFT